MIYLNKFPADNSDFKVNKKNNKLILKTIILNLQEVKSRSSCKALYLLFPRIASVLANIYLFKVRNRKRFEICSKSRMKTSQQYVKYGAIKQKYAQNQQQKHMNFIIAISNFKFLFSLIDYGKAYSVSIIF